MQCDAEPVPTFGKTHFLRRARQASHARVVSCLALGLEVAASWSLDNNDVLGSVSVMLGHQLLGTGTVDKAEKYS